MKVKLIDVYIQEVTRRLPRKMRQDIALELRSTIDDMLPVNYDEEDVKAVLNQLGNPLELANGYKDGQSYLIGPHYYDTYVSLLKIVLPIVALVMMIATMTKYFTTSNGDSIIEVTVAMVLAMLGNAFSIVAQVFLGLTVSFAIIERLGKRGHDEALSINLEKWSADDLKHVTYIPAKRTISKWEVFCQLLWTACWVTIYFYANQLVGVYEQTDQGLRFMMPALNQDVLLSFWPLVIGVATLEIGLALYKLAIGQWTKKLAVLNGVVEAVSTAAFMIVIMAPALLNVAFVVYMNDLLNLSINQWDTSIIAMLIVISILIAIYNIYDGFKKSNAL